MGSSLGGAGQKTRPGSVRYRRELRFMPHTLRGQTHAITGTTSGTGLAAAIAVAKAGVHTLLLNRPSERATAAERKIRKVAEVNGATVTTIECDLADFASVRRAAEEVKAACPDGLDVLCCNAGVMALQDVAAKDGYDVQITTNHLSHFLLTKELMPLLEQKANARPDGEARVVHMTSECRRIPGTPFSARHFAPGSGGALGGEGAWWQMLTVSGPKWERYHQTKLANALFTYALHEKLQARGSRVKALLAHPGGSATELQVTTCKQNGLPLWPVQIFWLWAMSAEDGAVGMIKCMTEPELPSGTFYGPRWISFGDAVRLRPEAQLVGAGAAAAKSQLWEASEKAVGAFPL